MTATRLYVRQNPIREADGWRYAEGRATEIDLETVDEYELQVLDSPEQIAKILTIDSQAEDLRRQAEDRVTTLHALLQRHPSLKRLRDEGLKDNEIVNEMKRLLEKTTEIQRGYQSGLYRRIQVLPSGTTVYRVRQEDMPEQSEYTESDPQLWGPRNLPDPEPIGRRTTQAIPLENTTRRMQHDGGAHGAEGEVNESRRER